MANPIPQAKPLVGGLKSQGHLDLDTPDGYGVRGRHLQKGGDGWHDSDAYGSIEAAQDAAEHASILGDGVRLSPKVYEVGANLTIGAPGVPVEVAPGAVLRPPAGVTYTIAGPVRADLRHWIDLSAGGWVVLAGVQVAYPQWFGAVGDGETNDGPAINAALRAVGYGSTVRFPEPPVRYLTKETLRIPSGITWDADANAEFFLDHGSDCGLITNADWENGNEDIVIRGGWYDGNRGYYRIAPNSDELGPDFEETGKGQRKSVRDWGQSIITLVNVRHARIENVHGQGAKIHGIDLTNRDYYGRVDERDTGCYDVQVINCSMRDCGDDAFTCHNSRMIVFRGCTAKDSAGTWAGRAASNGFEIDDGMEEVLISDAIVERTNYGIVVKGHAKSASAPNDTPGAKHVTIDSALIKHCKIALDIGGGPTAGSPIFGYNITASGVRAIACNRLARISNVHDVVISECTLDGFDDDDAASPIVTTGGAYNVTIAHCHLRGRTGLTNGAITVGRGTRNVTVAENTIEECSRGIWINGNYVTVKGNTIRNVLYAGIVVTPLPEEGGDEAEGIDISNNLIDGAGAEGGSYGIRINAPIKNSRVCANRIFGVRTPTSGAAGAISVTNERGSARRLLIAENIIDCPEARAGIYLRGDEGPGEVVEWITVKDNVISNAQRYGIILYRVSHSNVVGNTLTANGTEQGQQPVQLHLTQGSTYNNIQNNVVRMGPEVPGLSRARWAIRINSLNDVGNFVANNDLHQGGTAEPPLFLPEGDTTTIAMNNRGVDI